MFRLLKQVCIMLYEFGESLGIGACKSNCVTAHASLLCTGGYHEQHNER